jgi:hypothetical protein
MQCSTQAGRDVMSLMRGYGKIQHASAVFLVSPLFGCNMHPNTRIISASVREFELQSVLYHMIYQSQNLMSHGENLTETQSYSCRWQQEASGGDMHCMQPEKRIALRSGL